MARRYDRSRYFEIQKLFYFQAGNPAVGSRNTYNYRIVPGKEDMRVYVWYGLVCFEKAEIVTEETFPLNEEGYLDLIYWNDEQYDVYAEKLAAGEVEGKRTYEDRD